MLPSVLHQAAPRLRQLRDTAQRAAARFSPGLVRVVGRGSTAARRSWRRSLQLRVVATTLVLSTLLVGAFGWLLASRITRGLVQAKVASVQQQVERGREHVNDQLSGVNQSSDPALADTVRSAVVTLANEQGSRVEVVMFTSPDVVLPPQAWPDQDAYQVLGGPELRGLRNQVGVEGKVAYQRVLANPDGQGERLFLVVGTPVPSNAARLELYYIYPLDYEIGLVNLVRTTVVVTGVALVGLLAMVAALVTRLVVRPVRLAARTAQRLSAGLLDQRMEVHGEDDLALLADSFNQMAANLQRQIIRLEEMSRLQRRFTSDVSHELRTPLTTVRMAADLIFGARSDFEPAVGRSAELLQAELDRFETLLSDLLEISRFDAGFAALDVEAVDLVGLAHRVICQLESLAERAGSRVEPDLPVEPVIVEVDPRRVERILRNLVGNAIEHAERRPVEMTIRADSAAVAVTVRDHGVGLKPGEEKLVFNRFWRADPSRARQTGGTGLGLSISLEDARLHGGWLEAWGEPGSGAQFRLTLPVRSRDRLLASPLPLRPDDPAAGRGAPRDGQAPADGQASADGQAPRDSQAPGDGQAGPAPAGGAVRPGRPGTPSPGTPSPAGPPLAGPSPAASPPALPAGAGVE